MTTYTCHLNDRQYCDPCALNFCSRTISVSVRFWEGYHGDLHLSQMNKAL